MLGEAAPPAATSTRLDAHPRRIVLNALTGSASNGFDEYIQGYKGGMLDIKMEDFATVVDLEVIDRRKIDPTTVEVVFRGTYNVKRPCPEGSMAGLTFGHLLGFPATIGPWKVKGIKGVFTKYERGGWKFRSAGGG